MSRKEPVKPNARNMAARTQWSKISKFEIVLTIYRGSLNDRLSDMFFMFGQ